MDSVAVFASLDTRCSRATINRPITALMTRVAFARIVTLHDVGHLALIFHPEALRVIGTELRAKASHRRQSSVGLQRIVPKKLAEGSNSAFATDRQGEIWVSAVLVPPMRSGCGGGG